MVPHKTPIDPTASAAGPNETPAASAELVCPDLAWLDRCSRIFFFEPCTSCLPAGQSERQGGRDGLQQWFDRSSGRIACNYCVGAATAAENAAENTLIKVRRSTFADVLQVRPGAVPRGEAWLESAPAAPAAARAPPRCAALTEHSQWAANGRVVGLPRRRAVGLHKLTYAARAARPFLRFFMRPRPTRSAHRRCQ